MICFLPQNPIRMRNTTVLPGKDKLEDMIASVEDGYYLTDAGNDEDTVKYAICTSFSFKISSVLSATI